MINQFLIKLNLKDKKLKITNKWIKYKKFRIFKTKLKLIRDQNSKVKIMIVSKI